MNAVTSAFVAETGKNGHAAQERPQDAEDVLADGPIDKPVPRLHDLKWLPRRQVKLHPRWRPGQRTGLARLLTTRRARVGDSAIPRELCDRLAGRLAVDLHRFEHLPRPPDTQSLEMVDFSCA